MGLVILLYLTLAPGTAMLCESRFPTYSDGRYLTLVIAIAYRTVALEVELFAKTAFSRHVASSQMTPKDAYPLVGRHPRSLVRFVSE